jgi:hypothetical protein
MPQQQKKRIIRKRKGIVEEGRYIPCKKVRKKGFEPSKKRGKIDLAFAALLYSGFCS